MSAAKKLCLVRWVEEETLSVCSSSGIREGQTAYVGAFAEFKWGGKYYEGEVLEMSGKLRASLSFICTRESVCI